MALGLRFSRDRNRLGTISPPAAARMADPPGASLDGEGLQPAAAGGQRKTFTAATFVWTFS